MNSIGDIFYTDTLKTSLYIWAEYTEHMTDQEIDELAFAISMYRLCQSCSLAHDRRDMITVAGERVCYDCYEVMLNKKIEEIAQDCGIYYINYSHKKDGIGGKVYFAKDGLLTKIGATTKTVKERLSAQGLDKDCLRLVLETSHPFELERFFHTRFFSKLPPPSSGIRKGREFFLLDENDIGWARSVVLLNDHSVTPIYGSTS